MSQKRKHTESAGAGQDSKGFSKKQRSEPASGGARFNPYRRPKAEPKANSTNKIKSRIRDLKRLLEHVNNVPKHKMSATQRVERERELEACEHELAEKATAGQDAAFRNKMISKYHQIRFYDRKKADRNLKKLKRELSSSDDRSNKTELLRRIHNAEVDLNYAIYYPLLKPYSSLYPNTKEEKSKMVDNTDSDDVQNHLEETDGPKGDHEIWRAVEEAIKTGTLQDLRDSKAEGPTMAKQKRETETKKKNPKIQKGIRPQILKGADTTGNDEEEDNDDFFE
ncbi:hypothetical protein B0J11DRAFT_576265 [Dendryphion nanum]|uniref:rRNA-processing protein EFG1 n=1 Tax=Dendryphion nanum TaxID=256645 RepID=A0A9P9EEJ9_9PLEO|nr:hypothetical protein B0J11DRAFT_576265 [Dendryphion nanum]